MTPAEARALIAEVRSQVWQGSDIARLLDGYTEALEENERLRAELVKWQSPCATVDPVPAPWVCPACKDPKCGDV